MNFIIDQWNLLEKKYNINVLNWSEEVFVIKIVKNTVLCSYIMSEFKGEEIVGMFCEKELQKKQITKSLELKK